MPEAGPAPRAVVGNTRRIRAAAIVAVGLLAAGCASTRTVSTRAGDASTAIRASDRDFYLAGQGCGAEDSADWQSQWTTPAATSVGYPDFDFVRTQLSRLATWDEAVGTGSLDAAEQTVVTSTILEGFQSASPSASVASVELAQSEGFGALSPAPKYDANARVYEFSTASVEAARMEQEAGSRILVGRTRALGGSGIVDLSFVALGIDGAVRPIGMCYSVSRAFREVPDQKRLTELIRSSNVDGVVAELKTSWSEKLKVTSTTA